MAEMFPVTGHYLRPDAEIVHSPVFESAVVKVSRGTEADLTPQESQALEPLTLKDNTIIHFFIVMSEHWLSLRSSLSRL
ncbi:hypothetical protein PC128_g9454 [Phytophthora cactorum]|nr:hypothetical protein PC128_g9454 [Phytophthora cactorum]